MQDRFLSGILLSRSPNTWAPYVVSRMEEFLQDHASCERKAAALAMSLVTKYPDRSSLIEPMVSLAREELEHFRQVYRVIRGRGGELLATDERDPYVNEMLRQLRHGRDERLLDRLVVSGLIEARGAERFYLLAEELTDPELKEFYQKLADRELGHHKIFDQISAAIFSGDQIFEARERLARIESEAMLRQPLRATLH